MRLGWNQQLCSLQQTQRKWSFILIKTQSFYPKTFFYSWSRHWFINKKMCMIWFSVFILSYIVVAIKAIRWTSRFIGRKPTIPFNNYDRSVVWFNQSCITMAFERLLIPFVLILLFFFCDITRCSNLIKDDSGKSQGISRRLMYNIPSRPLLSIASYCLLQYAMVVTTILTK